jgi:hypothetical protein
MQITIIQYSIIATNTSPYDFLTIYRLDNGEIVLANAR